LATCPESPVGGRAADDGEIVGECAVGEGKDAREWHDETVRVRWRERYRPARVVIEQGRRAMSGRQTQMLNARIEIRATLRRRFVKARPGPE
jgi:hypothetical protein